MKKCIRSVYNDRKMCTANRVHLKSDTVARLIALESRIKYFAHTQARQQNYEIYAHLTYIRTKMSLLSKKVFSTEIDKREIMTYPSTFSVLKKPLCKM